MDSGHTALLGERVEASSDEETHGYLECEDQTHREADWQASPGDSRSVESSNPFLAVADVPLTWRMGYPVAGGASHPEHARESIARCA